MTRAMVNMRPSNPAGFMLATISDGWCAVLQRGRICIALFAGLAAGGCATFSPDGGLSDVNAIAKVEINAEVQKITSPDEAGNSARRVKALLGKPLSSENAVRLALLNNRGLQAALNELGIAEAQMVAASLPPNPRFSLTRTTAAGALEIERQIAGSLFALATLPARQEIASEKFRVAQFKAAEAIFKLAADTRRQYYRAIAANHQVAILQQAKASAAASSELLKRLGESGAVNKLNQSREFAFYTELGVQLGQARLQQKIEREKLTRLLGLWGKDIDFRIPGALPALPRLQPAKAIEAEALRKRIDFQIALADLSTLAKSYGLTEATQFISDIDLLARSTRDRSIVTDAATGAQHKEVTYKRTFELEIEIPIYDFGQTRMVQAEQTYMQAANRVAEKAVNIRSEAREAYMAYRGTYDIARLYQAQVLPLRKIIQDEALLQYNGMLIDVTQLIADARARNLSQIAAVNALRDFWLAHSDFRHAIIGGGMAGAPGSGAGATAQAAEAGGH